MFYRIYLPAYRYSSNENPVVKVTKKNSVDKIIFINYNFQCVKTVTIKTILNLTEIYTYKKKIKCFVFKMHLQKMSNEQTRSIQSELPEQHVCSLIHLNK